AHERIAARFLFGENARSLVFAGFRLDRLRAQELRRQYHLVAEDEAIDDEMMPIDLPAPGPLRRGRTHDAHPVIPLAIFLGPLRQLANMLVEPHYVARGLEAGGAEARAQQIERALALLGAEVLKKAAERVAVGGDADKRLRHLRFAAIEHFLQDFGEREGLQSLAGTPLPRPELADLACHDPVLPCAATAWRDAITA